MLELDSARQAILRELDAAVGRLEAVAPQDWDRPTRCEGWTVRHVAKHLNGGPAIMSEAFTRMNQGVSEAGGMPGIQLGDDPGEIIGALRSSRARLADVLGTLTPDGIQAPCPLPFGTFPGFVALHILTMEMGVHHSDIQAALGEELPLPADITDATILLSSNFHAIAEPPTEQPEDGIAYRITSPSASIALVRRDGSWEAGEDPSARTCEIGGDDSAVALFVMGRIPADHAWLTVGSEPELAGKFKAYFPGP